MEKKRMGLCLLRSIIFQKHYQQCLKAIIITRSIYNYSPLSSYNPIFQSSSSSSIIIPNFHIHTLSRIANPSPTLNRHRKIIKQSSWLYDNYDDSSSSSSSSCFDEEAEHNSCFHMITVFSDLNNTIIPPIDNHDQLDAINSEIYHCCEVNQVKYGFSLLAGIIKLGLVPNRYTYCPLLIGLMLQDRFSEATDMFTMLIKHTEIPPHVLTYETIIQVCFDMGYDMDVNEFSKFLTYAKMVIRDEPLVDIKEYYSCRRRKKHQWRRGRQNHRRPRHVSYEPHVSDEPVKWHYFTDYMTLDIYCKEKCFDKALSRIRDDAGIEVYNTLMRYMVHAGEIDQAMNLFYGLWDKNLKPNATTYAIVIHGLGYKGLWDEALDLVNDVYTDDDFPDDFRMACDNFFQEHLPPYLDMPYLTHAAAAAAAAAAVSSTAPDDSGSTTIQDKPCSYIHQADCD